jgi:hypothetical protein
LICGLSGLYFLEFFGLASSNTVLIFTPLVWDLIHTWSGVVMTAAGILHFSIHWKWVVKVLGKYGNGLFVRKPVQRLDPALSNSVVPVEERI